MSVFNLSDLGVPVANLRIFSLKNRNIVISLPDTESAILTPTSNLQVKSPDVSFAIQTPIVPTMQ